MAGYGCLGLGLFYWVLLAVPVGAQAASSLPGAHVTTLAPPPQSEASVLSLNLGLITSNSTFGDLLLLGGALSRRSGHFLLGRAGSQRKRWPVG